MNPFFSGTRSAMSIFYNLILNYGYFAIVIMMFDKLYLYYAKNKKPELDTAYTPNKAVAGRLHVNPRAPKLAVIFPPWHGSRRLHNILIKRLAKKGWSVLFYQLHGQLLIADDELVVKSFHHVQKAIAQELKELSAKHNYQKVHLIGMSLGNVSLSMVADDYPGFSEATLVVAGDDLAIDLWHGSMTQDLRKLFEQAHLGIRKLASEWRDEAPILHAKRFKNKEVKFYLSLTDKVIRTDYQKKMAEGIAQAGAKIIVKKTRLGHTMTIAKYCLFTPLP